jgi:nuclear transport factor 2 (NTF2) superfamily protein
MIQYLFVFMNHFLQDWTFEPSGLMKNRQASINDVAITQEERWFAGLDDSTVDNSLIPVGHI